MVVGFGIWLAVSSDCTCWWIHEKTQVRPYLRTASCHRPGLKFEHVELSWFSMIFLNDFLWFSWDDEMIHESYSCAPRLRRRRNSRVVWVGVLSSSRVRFKKRDFNSVPHCYAILPGGAFWKLQLARWATSTSLGVLWWFQISLMVPEHQVNWVNLYEKRTINALQARHLHVLLWRDWSSMVVVDIEIIEPLSCFFRALSSNVYRPQCVEPLEQLLCDSSVGRGGVKVFLIGVST